MDLIQIKEITCASLMYSIPTTLLKYHRNKFHAATYSRYVAIFIPCLYKILLYTITITIKFIGYTLYRHI